VANEFIGAGWAFPLRTDAVGNVALVRETDEIEESIRLILGTAHGERPMRPKFGCGIHNYVFAPVDATTAGRLAYEVRAALAQWEPRIDVIDIVVTNDPSTPTTLYIDIRYSIRGTNDPRNLVFPFYTIPDEGEAPTIPNSASLSS
jgi:phage baseplate assembly protein W